MKKQNKWEENQKKAEAMCDKFINVLEKLDAHKHWYCTLFETLISRMQKDGEDIGGIIDTLEIDFNLKVFKIENLAQEIRLESFLNEIQSNPCQLKLIA